MLCLHALYTPDHVDPSAFGSYLLTSLFLSSTIRYMPLTVPRLRKSWTAWETRFTFSRRPTLWLLRGLFSEQLEIPQTSFHRLNRLRQQWLLSSRWVRWALGLVQAILRTFCSYLVLLFVYQKVKSNKDDCKHLARRTAEIFQDIYRQTKDFSELPPEVQSSINQIERLVAWVVPTIQYSENIAFIAGYSTTSLLLWRILKIKIL